MTKILLVEDNEINRDMLRRRLERKGYEVIVAINGAEGVAKTQAEQPDLVLMDLHLPILDGWEATRQIKANPQTQTIPVIALTADAIAGEREKALAAGCDEYDTKPVDFTRLLEKMAMLLEPPVSQPSPSVNQPLDQHLQQITWTRCRRDLEPPIYSIIGYSDLLLDALSDSQDFSLANDLQKIHLSGLQLLKLIQAILNPALLEVQQQDWTINFLAPALRRELLTPLSTIIGYCELLLEEAPPDLIPDLQQIYNSAQDLLNLVNSLDSLMTRHLQSIQTIDTHELNAAVWQRITTPRTDQSSVETNNRILVIDSTPKSSIFRQLERQNYPTHLATTGEQTLQILAANSCDLILLDINQMGLKVLEQLKSHEQYQQIPVLIISAFDETALVMQAIAMGAVDYLTKPFPSAFLRAKVTDALEQTRLRQQLVHYEGIVAELNQHIEALQLEVEQLKRSQQVAEIVQTDYFQQLQPNVTVQELPNLPPSDPLPLKILLVEDNELNSDMLCRRLQRYGYEVVIANDGAEGVSKAISEQPQVILMDISLPVMDGWEATQQLKANPQTCRIPIIALTAHAMTGDREKALASGCDDYDTKPIELPRLLSKIEDCLKSSTSN